MIKVFSRDSWSEFEVGKIKEEDMEEVTEAPLRREEVVVVFQKDGITSDAVATIEGQLST